MLKFDQETKIKGMGKNKSKKGFFFSIFSQFFPRFFVISQSDASIYLKLKINSSQLLITFADGLPDSYTDHYLKLLISNSKMFQGFMVP